MVRDTFDPRLKNKNKENLSIIFTNSDDERIRKSRMRGITNFDTRQMALPP